jgi:hypothetical protein
VSAEQATALLVALTGLVGAIGVLVAQLHQMRKDLNGRLTELVATTKLAAQKTGELAGRDWTERRGLDRPDDVQRVPLEQNEKGHDDT